MKLQYLEQSSEYYNSVMSNVSILTRSTSMVRSSISPLRRWLTFSRPDDLVSAASNCDSASNNLAPSFFFRSSTSSDLTPPSPLSHFCFQLAASALAFCKRRWRSARPLCSSSSCSRACSRSAFRLRASPWTFWRTRDSSSRAALVSSRDLVRACLALASWLSCDSASSSLRPRSDPSA